MQRELFSPKGCPKPTGPFSPCVRKGPFVFTAGQVGAVPETGKLISDDVVEQTAQALKNLEAALEAAGATFCDVVKVNIFLTDMGDFERMNAEYGKVFTAGAPARTCVAVKAVPVGGKVEIEMVAIVDWAQSSS